MTEILDILAYHDAIAAVCPIDGVDSTGDIHFAASATDQQKQAASAAAAAYENLPIKKVIVFAEFIGRWSDAEYTLLMQRRATAISDGNIGFVKQWDRALAAGRVDLNLKTTVVTAGILTQARADEIFA
jgi:hypothetical protein